MKTQYIILDWKEFSEDAERQFKQALKTFGVHMYLDPDCDGTDAYGFILSDTKLTAKQVRAMSIANTQ